MVAIRTITPTPFSAMGAAPQRGGQVDLPQELRRGLRLWLDANQIPNKRSGDKVGIWPDVSGNGKDFAQAVSTKQPTFQENVLNRYPVVRFDGSDWLRYSSLTEWNFFHQGLGATFLCVVNRTSAGGDTLQYVIGSTASSLHHGWAVTQLDPADQVRLTVTRGVGGSPTIVPIVNNAWPIGKWVSNLFTLKDQPGDDVTISVCGKSVISAEKNNPYSSADATNHLTLGSQSNADFRQFIGDMAEIFLWDRPLNRAERADVSWYIALKYALWMEGQD